MKLTELDTPSLLIDRDKLIRNIARAKASCAKLGVHWRPHLKTHKCLEIARLQIEDPTGPATVSLSVKITFATLSVLHGVVKHAIFAGVYR